MPDIGLLVAIKPISGDSKMTCFLFQAGVIVHVEVHMGDYHFYYGQLSTSVNFS
jgi:hypothetical protein